ncbi:MAG: GAF domain-containing protein [Candidatus Krumholzibacteria bacterium]|nr:GAF domain-containing protein [Candidatus Krumholzibacteria bacterium]
MATETVLGRILRDVRETRAEDHETTLVRCLAEVGSLLDVDRCYYHPFAEESRGRSGHCGWCAPGAPPMSGNEWSLGCARASWLQTRLRDEGALVIADLRSVEPGDVPERERWLRQGLTSLLVVPTREHGELAGLIGCETLGRVRRWNAHDRRVLETVADLCQFVRHRKATLDQLAQANERAASLAEVMAEPVAMVDSSGRVVVWNAALAKLGGISGATAAKREESRMRAHAERLERAVASQQAELEQAQRQLVESEKMAAVARLVTGLAREIDVPVTGSREAANHLATLAADIERGYRDGGFK